MKKIVRHRFEDYEVRPDTQILIVGTFNPETPENEAKFFYGRSRNHLWRLLPMVYQQTSLKGESREAQEEFINANKISFTDLIAAVMVDVDKQDDYSDAHLDKCPVEWNTVLELIGKLPHLKKVVVTRKTFKDVPNIKKQVAEIEKVCVEKSVVFECLPTPARFYNEEKQFVWNKALTL